MTHCIGIVLQASASRYGRERIDLPLAFASMDLPVKVFLLGDASYDLYPSSKLKPSGESAWSKLWGMLAELDADICVPTQSPLLASGQLRKTAFKVSTMTDQQLAQAMAGCRHLLHV